MRQSLILLLFIGMITPLALNAQTVEGFHLPVEVASQTVVERPIPLEDITPFLAYAVKWTAPATDVGNPQIRFSRDGADWTDWLTLPPDSHTAFSEPVFLSSLHTTAANQRYVQIQFPAAEQSVAAEIHFYSPGNSSGGESLPRILDMPEFCPCPHPPFQGRLDWCPSGDCPTDPTPQPTVVTHLIVHHSAGSNTSNDWAARVRAIWAFHTGSNGWDDIGYNWLIDPNGVLYEGRSDNMQGAHFCGQNGGTMGICVIGTYSNVPPTNAAQATLRDLLAWKSCKENIDPVDFSFHNSSGLNLFHIAGHRDGCSTVCPGDSLWSRLPVIRTAVADYIASDCSAIPGPSQLVAELADATTAEVSWTDNSSTETAFLLERGTPGLDDFEQLIELPANTTTFLDTDLTPGAYAYRVRATDGMDTTFYSNEDDVLVLPNGTIQLGDHTQIETFPVPFGEVLQIRLRGQKQGSVKVSLIGVDGREVIAPREFLKEAGEQMTTISTAGLPSGAYFLQVTMEGEVRIEKVIKE